jgi:hypothetical protein
MLEVPAGMRGPNHPDLDGLPGPGYLMITYAYAYAYMGEKGGEGGKGERGKEGGTIGGEIEGVRIRGVLRGGIRGVP